MGLCQLFAVPAKKHRGVTTHHTSRADQGVNLLLREEVHDLGHDNTGGSTHAKLFDLRGNRYLDYPSKFYAVDTGIRNSRLNFRQDENTHLMENVIYNELVRRDYAVDVGVVEMFATVEGKRCRKRYEVDFVVNKSDKRFYIQSAWNIPDNEKREQETFSLRHIGDNFRKIVVIENPYENPWTDKNGITFMGIVPFLLNPKSLETF